jgi:hypothetical protein
MRFIGIDVNGENRSDCPAQSFFARQTPACRAILFRIRREFMRMSRFLLLSVVPVLAFGTAAVEVTFIPHRIRTNRTEACGIADFHGDGKLGIVVADMDGNGDWDLVTTGKWGPVLIENRLKR